MAPRENDSSALTALLKQRIKASPEYAVVDLLQKQIHWQDAHDEFKDVPVYKFLGMVQNALRNIGRENSNYHHAQIAADAIWEIKEHMLCLMAIVSGDDKLIDMFGSATPKSAEAVFKLPAEIERAKKLLEGSPCESNRRLQKGLVDLSSFYDETVGLAERQQNQISP